METFFGKYQVKKELGRGAMGSVYLAFDPVLEREVAIKTISSTIRDKHLKERFIREAKAAGKLSHSNIVTIYDFGVEKDRLFIAMEYLEGQDLSQLIFEKISMDIKDKLEIVRQICLGLDYAHQQEIYHRDIKPANVRLLKDGSVKIVDFGLAVMQRSSLTQSGAFLGTPNYVSPERLHGESGDGRSDQFAVGIVLYELLTYSRAFEGDTISTVIYNVLNAEPRRLDPKIGSKFPELESIIKKAIKKNPDYRYPSMKEMAADIEVLLEKMKKRRYSMTESIEVMDEQMNGVPKDKDIDELVKMKTALIEKKKSPRLIAAIRSLIAIAIMLSLLALVYFFLLKKSPPSHALEPGFLAFDVKPYAVVQKVINVKTGKTVPIEESETTPLRLRLESGEYKVVYSHPRWDGKSRSKVVTIAAGETIYEKDCIDDQFIKDAIRHFSVSREYENE